MIRSHFSDSSAAVIATGVSTLACVTFHGPRLSAYNSKTASLSESSTINTRSVGDTSALPYCCACPLLYERRLTQSRDCHFVGDVVLLQCANGQAQNII